jgi:hypothetical protein
MGIELARRSNSSALKEFFFCTQVAKVMFDPFAICWKKYMKIFKAPFAHELRKMRNRAQITITGTQRNRIQKEKRVEECRRNQLGGISLAIIGSD